jgi:hypothetical protein
MSMHVKLPSAANPRGHTLVLASCIAPAIETPNGNLAVWILRKLRDLRLVHKI